MVRLVIEHTWDGAAIGADERATVEVHRKRDREEIIVLVDAPHHRDPPPAGEPGRTDGLWNHEVVELFLLGADEHYLELELGPHGHHLAIDLVGRRRPTGRVVEVDYATTLSPHRWHGRAVLPERSLPRALARANAYAIHGAGDRRRYLAAHPVMGASPDFHRLEAFAPISL